MSDPSIPDPSSPDSDSYVVVARRYRPRSFEELVGQEHVGKALKNAIETGRVGHAYLFTGARGVGKTSTARIFAKALNNPGGPNAIPDNDSDVAQAIDSGEDIDVIEIDGASNRGIDEIRSLRANVSVRPSRSRFKIYIIDEVHMLTQAAFNALLKTLEEPPEHVKFIFCTTDPEKMPITVLSRCQRFDFSPVEVPKIVKRLREIVTAEKANADDAALELIARRAAGSMRDSQSLLEQVLSFSDGNLTADHVHSMLGTADDVRLHALAKAMCDRDAAAALSQLDEAIDAGVDAGRIAEQLLGYFRDLMAVTVGCEPSLQRHTAASMHPELKQLGDSWGLQTVLAVVALIDQTLVRIRLSVYGRVLLESTLIQICNLPDLQAISDLAAAASSGKPLSTTKPRSASQGESQPEKKKVVADSAAVPPTPPPPSTEQLSATEPSPVAPSHPSQKPASKPTFSPAVSAAVAMPSAAMPSAAIEQAAPSSAAETHQQPAVSQGAATEAGSPESPAGEPAAAPPVVHPKMQLTSSTVHDVFKQSLQGAQQTIVTVASMAEVRWSSDSEITLAYPPESSMAMKRMEQAEYRGAIGEALQQIVGRPIQLNLVTGASRRSAPAQAKPVAPKLTAKEKMDRMREVEAYPWIQACVETFQAEVVKVDMR